MANNFCSNCGAPILNKNSNFCSNCGVHLVSTQNVISSPSYTITDSSQNNIPNISNENTHDKVNALLDQFYQKYSFNGCDIYLWNFDKKSNKKIQSAINHYANIDMQSNEIPIACFDDTVNGNASDGALISSHGVYIHNAGEETHFLPYHNVSEVMYKSGLLTKKVFLNSYIYINFSAVLEVNVRAFAEIIIECKKILSH